MDRGNEYQELLQELENTPAALEYAVSRAEAKIRSKNRRRYIAIPFSSVATFLAVFVILMNTSVSFAYACGRIPLIKDLAKFVAFSPSLSAAVENQYVQPIGLEQSRNGVTARVEYVIVDQKQLNIFYSLSSNVYSALDDLSDIKDSDENRLSACIISSGSFDIENGDLRHVTVDFTERSMPDNIILSLDVYDIGSYWRDQPVQVNDSLIDTEEQQEQDGRKYISTFAFTLDFDPYFTAQGEIIPLNKTFEIDGQTLIATTIDIYPTHIRFNLDDAPNNTAWLQSLEFYLEDENGRRFDTISNGISATGKVDSRMMASHRLESSFFSNAKKLTLYISGVTWLDKEMERVKLDLKNKTAEALPQDVILEKAVRKGNDWMLTFSGRMRKENASHQLWGHDYYDEKGTKYWYSSSSSSYGAYYDYDTEEHIEDANKFYVKFALKDYPYDTVYLSPSYTDVVKLSEPVEIKIK